MAKVKLKDKILYAPLALLFHCIALLPFWVLYRISDLLFLLMFYVVRYRKKVVIQNLNECFPEKSESERKQIMKDFYKHLADTFIETIKLLHVSDDEMRRRIVFHNVDEVDKSIEQGRSVAMYASHYCNWEWLSAITMWSKYDTSVMQFGQVYHPLENAWWDEFLLNLRSRFKSYSYPMSRVLRELLAAKSKGKITITGFISDQHPHANDIDDVITFLNHYTAFITGPEIMAKKMDMDVLYFDVRKVRRGYYDCTIRVISRTPKEEPQFKITNTYAQMLENVIKESPAEWLWTHKRWKRPVTPKNLNTDE
ncbi:MAG: acetyltransferase [Bacteroidales bacterium]|nr:acetyltransferase [Bacteroidales bacterium]